jgi:hypothetical protein
MDLGMIKTGEVFLQVIEPQPETPGTEPKPDAPSTPAAPGPRDSAPTQDAKAGPKP